MSDFLNSSSDSEQITEHFCIRFEKHYMFTDPLWIIYNSSRVGRGFEVAGCEDREAAVRECYYLERLNFS